jgi:hypothetical protein
VITQLSINSGEALFECGYRDPPFDNDDNDDDVDHYDGDDDDDMMIMDGVPIQPLFFCSTTINSAVALPY